MSFFDLQVNGYAGVDFNQDDLDPADLHRACERLESDGVIGVLGTIITDEIAVMCRRVSAGVSKRSLGSKMIFIPGAARATSSAHATTSSSSAHLNFRQLNPSAW